MLAAWPRHTVPTGQLTWRMVSYMASPAVTMPPGELIYSQIGASGSSLCKNRSWAQIMLAVASSMGSSSMMIRSRNSREYISQSRSRPGKRSTTNGIITAPFPHHRRVRRKGKGAGGRYAGGQAFRRPLQRLLKPERRPWPERHTSWLAKVPGKPHAPERARCGGCMLHLEWPGRAKGPRWQ